MNYKIPYLPSDEEMAQVIKDFKHIREYVQKAMDSAPKSVTYEEALKQVLSFKK